MEVVIHDTQSIELIDRFYDKNNDNKSFYTLSIKIRSIISPGKIIEEEVCLFSDKKLVFRRQKVRSRKIGTKNLVDIL